MVNIMYVFNSYANDGCVNIMYVQFLMLNFDTNGIPYCMFVTLVLYFSVMHTQTLLHTHAHMYTHKHMQAHAHRYTHIMLRGGLVVRKCKAMNVKML